MSSPQDVNQVSAGTSSSPTYTVSWDWAWMSELTDAAYRIYTCVRSYAIEGKTNDPIELTDEFIAHITRRSVSAVKRARKLCYEHGVLRELSSTRVSIPPDEPGGKPQVRTVRKLQVLVQPTHGYQGPVNCFDEHDRFVAEKEAGRTRQRKRGRAAAAGSSEGSDLHPHNDQGERGGYDVSAGHSEGSDLTDRDANLTDRDANLLDFTPSDQGKRAPERSREVSSQPTKAAAAAASSAEQSGNGGWVDDAHEQGTTATAAASPEPDTAGAGLLRALKLPKGATPLTAKAAGQWAPTVDSALAGPYSPVALVERLTDGLGDTRNPAGVVISRLGDLDAELRQQAERTGGSPEGPAWCGDCGSHYPDARAQKNPRFRKVLGDDRETEYKCPACHPTHPDRQPVAA